MRLIGKSHTSDGWYVEVSREEMQVLAPTFDQNWRVTFLESIAFLDLNVRQRNALRRAAYRSFSDTEFGLCFKKDGMILSFEEWCRQDNLVARLKVMHNIGPVVAHQIAEAVRKYVADNPNEYVPRKADKMTGVIDNVALRTLANRIIDQKSVRENILIQGTKVEIIGGPQVYTITSVPKELITEIVYQILLKQENDRLDWEEKQWRGG